MQDRVQQATLARKQEKGGIRPVFPGKVTVYSVSHRDQFRNVLHTLQPALRAAKEPVQRPRFAALRSERDD